MSEERYINASGHRLYYEYISRDLLETDKPVLIFLHEGLGCIPSWKKFPQLLCEKLDLPALLYDRYGYGKSEMVKEPRNVDFLQKEALDVLPELLEKLNLHKKKIILIGHS
ncbi:MAG: alpha/beta hydrolase, partial [Marinilabiliales bacterium]